MCDSPASRRRGDRKGPGSVHNTNATNVGASQSLGCHGVAALVGSTAVMLGVRRCHLVSIALLALATTAGAQSSDNSGPRTDLALQDAIARALARNLDISVERLDQQVIEVARINRDIADIDLRQTIANTVSSVQNAYWDLVHTTQTVAVQQQRLEWAETLVRENEARVEAGTLDPIQTVQARAEAAVLRQILAEAQLHLATAELALKRLIVGGTDDAYWAATLNPVDSPQLDVQPTQPTAAAVPGISRRIEAATEARELAEERLAIEQSRFAAGLQTNFFVVQAQRDLATAKDTELRAILDHQKALVEFERVQRTSLSQPLISIVR
ncbi:MAG TPA: hypothetical protein EYM63_07735 [Acidobacteria bacterium]|nr:hypothetical protein [Acidobacteriota bacterium]